MAGTCKYSGEKCLQEKTPEVCLRCPSRPISEEELLEEEERELGEIDDDEKAITWEEYGSQRCGEIAQALEELEGSICPCGHTYAQHDPCTDQCYICECPRFGEPLENWETYTEVWYTEPPGGHHYYE